MELRGVEPLRPACKAGIIPLDHSPENWSRRRESNPHPFVYETNALPHELLRKELIVEARGGVEPRAFPPSSFRFGLEDRRRERGPDLGGDGEIRTHTLLFTGQPLCQLELHRQIFGRGVRPTTPLRTPQSLTVTVLPGMSHAPITC